MTTRPKIWRSEQQTVLTMSSLSRLLWLLFTTDCCPPQVHSPFVKGWRSPRYECMREPISFPFYIHTCTSRLIHAISDRHPYTTDHSNHMNAHNYIPLHAPTHSIHSCCMLAYPIFLEQLMKLEIDQNVPRTVGNSMYHVTLCIVPCGHLERLFLVLAVNSDWS